MQAVMSASQRRFTIEEQSDPVEFCSWLLNTLHLGLTGMCGDGEEGLCCWVVAVISVFVTKGAV
jgi:hypothetical protein